MKLSSRMSLPLLCAASLAGAIAFAGPAAAAVEGPVVVVSALYGSGKTTQPVDFADRLAESCGRNISYCQAFCSRAAAGIVGRRPGLWGGRPLCRVVYRCGDQMTRAVEAMDNESFTLSCRSR
ncbi:MAG: hypothetical protein ABI056_04540 [Caulobacteraceae bacterium]